MGDEGILNMGGVLWEASRRVLPCGALGQVT